MPLWNLFLHGIQIGQGYTATTAQWNTHDDVIKWKHFPRYWHFVQEIHQSPVNSPHKGQCTWSFDVSFDLLLNKRRSKQLRGMWFEMPSCSLWCHFNVFSGTFLVKLLPDQCPSKSTVFQVMAWCRMATSITCGSVDPNLCCHVASLGHKDLKRIKGIN